MFLRHIEIGMRNATLQRATSDPHRLDDVVPTRIRWPLVTPMSDPLDWLYAATRRDNEITDVEILNSPLAPDREDVRACEVASRTMMSVTMMSVTMMSVTIMSVTMMSVIMMCSTIIDPRQRCPRDYAAHRQHAASRTLPGSQFVDLFGH